MNRRFRSALLILIGLVVVIAFARYLYLHADEYQRLLRLSAGGMAMLFVLALGIPLFNGMQNTLLYRSLGLKNFTHREGFLIAAASSLANQLPIPGGLVSKGFYLKRIHQLSYALFTSSTLALFVCFVSLDGFIGLLILLYWALVMKVPAPLSLWIGFLAMAAAILVFLLPVERLRLPERIHARVQQALEGWVHIREHPLMVLKVLGIQVIMILLAAARYWLAFHMLSQDVTFGQVLLMSNASILTQVVSIAPGGLGVREAIVGGVAAMLGFDMAASVLAVGLDRLMSTAVIFLAGGASMLLLGSQLSAQSQASPDQDNG
jgi:uncharacterized membrane protein YbhN (UPF0104 family)